MSAKLQRSDKTECVILRLRASFYLRSSEHNYGQNCPLNQAAIAVVLTLLQHEQFLSRKTRRGGLRSRLIILKENGSMATFNAGIRSFYFTKIELVAPRNVSHLMRLRREDVDVGR